MEVPLSCAREGGTFLFRFGLLYTLVRTFRIPFVGTAAPSRSSHLQEKNYLMKRFALAILAALLLVSGSSYVARAEDKPSEEKAPEAYTGEVVALDSLEEFKEDTTEAKPLLDFANQNFKLLIGQMSESPDTAEKHIAAIKEAMEGVEAGENVQAKGLIMSIDRSLDMFRSRIAAKRLTLDEVKSQVTESPSDTDAITLYITRVSMAFSEETGEDVAKMEAFLKAENEFIDSLQEETEESDALASYKRASSLLKSLGSRIERLKVYQEMVGKEMMPVEAEVWANGEGFTPEELEGKVVLLDFWAIWCGPCVASFPHLVELQEKYGDEGLQIVGITRYYGYTWSEETDSPQRGEEEVAPEVEQEVLNKFTAQHDLKHPTAVVTDPKALYEFYAVSGIPHFVLIGRDGKIKYANAGMGEARAKQLEELIKQELAEPAAG